MKKIVIYTDGACKNNPGAGGWAAILLFDREGKQEKIVCGGQALTTNNEMELMAALRGLCEALKHSPDKVTIKSDSAYVVNSVNLGWLAKWKRNDWMTKADELVKNKILWGALDRAMAETEVEFVKIKGHSGDHYNERADKIAQEKCLVKHSN
jgi:ribonuclease HI